jgi:hypothetical protein
MRISLSVSIIIFLIACGPMTGFAGIPGNSAFADSSVKIKPVFGADFEKGLYRSVLDIGKNHLTGFAFIKKTSDSSYRVLFSNEFGMQFFDLEFFPGRIMIHSCFPSLNRKSLISLFQNDFGMLFFPLCGIKKISPKGNENNGELTIKVKNASGKWMFSATSPEGRIRSIRSSGKIFPKTRIGIKETGELVTGIDIFNPLIKLHITMDQISQ